ncbi:GNAT family N-acetyltransferase, partial [Mycolicibacterium mageritense]|uniref:GNAT family N-acetyltransferase n=1 Tax=Mycolicibacterium mageritense TaxID=53462 RepID=UPI001E3F6E94
MPEDSTVSAKSIDSDRVRLRKARDGDAAGIIETQIDERIRRHLGGPRSEPEVRALVESVGAAALLAAPGHFVVADKHTDEMLGTVLLDRRGLDVPGHVEAAGNELELTYVFRHSAWGHGYATEAAGPSWSPPL